jgi:tripeptidyl-peptidase I
MSANHLQGDWRRDVSTYLPKKFIRPFLHIFSSYAMVISFLFVAIIALSCALAKHVLKESSNLPKRSDFRLGNRAASTLVHQVVFAIEQKNIDRLETILYDVSNMDSPNYGDHLSFEKVGELVKNEEALSAVSAWLHGHDVSILSQTTYGEYITCSATVGKWEELFDTTFHEYHDVVDPSVTTMSTPVVIRSQSLSLPEELIPHVATVFNTADLPPRVSRLGVAKKLNADEIEKLVTFPSNYVTPAKLNALYGITGNSSGYGSLAIFETSSDTFLASDLLLFQQTFGLPIDAVDNYVGSFPDPTKCNTDISECTESSLDIQYILAVAPNTPSTFWYTSVNEGSFLSFITSVSNTVDPPKVFSISWAAYEDFQQFSSLIAFNIEAIKLGVRGVSIMAASGDDGVTGFLFPGQALISNCGYYPMWPASSPYVTAVGGTQDGIALTGKEEVACSIDTGADITSGGGFSFRFPAPSFQRYAIGNYSARFTAAQPPASNGAFYYYTNRGYPDVSSAAADYSKL